jgi:pimeloyl-ACP methyl ester carboxylesterase
MTLEDEHTPEVYPLRDVAQHRVAIDGTPIHYLRAGDAGPAVVLLHGGIIDAAHVSWAPQLDTLADNARIYAPNLPGYGPNRLPGDDLTIPHHVETMAGFLDALDLEDAVVAGISMGGGVALGLGLDHPDRLDHVVALDAMGLGSELSGGKLTWLLAKLRVTNRFSVALMRRSRAYVRLGLEALVYENDDIPPTLVDLVQAEAGRPGAGSAFRNFRANEVTWQGYRTDYTDRLSAFPVPTTLVHGREDEVFPVAWAERAARDIPAADLHVLEDCGHLPTWERTDRVAEIITAVL